ncbi:MAG: hypothetical protein HC853_07380 [Anaerolineae bacterium]|nr:hypothetical protein [Anaerolineae bacterium]
MRWKFAYWLANAGTDTNNDHVDVDYIGQTGGNTNATSDRRSLDQPRLGSPAAHRGSR